MVRITEREVNVGGDAHIAPAEKSCGYKLLLGAFAAFVKKRRGDQFSSAISRISPSTVSCSRMPFLIR